MNFIDYHLHIDDLHLHYSDALNILQVTDYSPNNPVVSETIQVFNQLEDIANIHGGYIIQMNNLPLTTISTLFPESFQ